MPRLPTERPLSELSTTALRLRKQVELSTKLPLKSRQEIMKSLSLVLAKIQEADFPATPPRTAKR